MTRGHLTYTKISTTLTDVTFKLSAGAEAGRHVEGAFAGLAATRAERGAE